MMCLQFALAIAGAYALAYWAALRIERLVDRPRLTPDFPCAMAGVSGHCAEPCGQCRVTRYVDGAAP